MKKSALLVFLSLVLPTVAVADTIRLTVTSGVIFSDYENAPYFILQTPNWQSHKIPPDLWFRGGWETAKPSYYPINWLGNDLTATASFPVGWTDDHWAVPAPYTPTVTGQPTAPFQAPGLWTTSVTVPFSMTGTVVGPDLDLAFDGVGTMYAQFYTSYDPNWLQWPELAPSYGVPMLEVVRFDFEPLPTPEPASLLLVGSGLGLVAWVRRRRQ
jgi:hypothetical protein